MVDYNNQAFDVASIPRRDEVEEIIGQIRRQPRRQLPPEAERDGREGDDDDEGVGAVEELTAFGEELARHAEQGCLAFVPDYGRVSGGFGRVGLAGGRWGGGWEGVRCRGGRETRVW